MGEFEPLEFYDDADARAAAELAAVKQLAQETRVIYEQMKRDELEMQFGVKSPDSWDDGTKLESKEDNNTSGKSITGESESHKIRPRRRSKANNFEPVNSLLDKLYPEQRSKMHKMMDVVRSWAWIVGENCAKHSAPYDLIGTKLCVESDSSQVRAQLFRVKGNICRKLKSRWDIDCDDLYVSAGPAPVKPSAAHQRPRRQYAIVTVTEQDVAEKLNVLDQFARSINDPKKPDYKCTLLEDNPKAARALAHLMAFFEKRFSKNNAKKF